MTDDALEILYLVHDLNDPAVAKRAAMLRAGGARVSLAGFRRGDDIREGTDLGRTENGAFIRRIASILRAAAGLRRHRDLFARADIVIARNLEMMALAVRGRALCKRPPALVYESLDIHRLLLGSGPASRALRALEGALSRRAEALLTSSSAFVREYFEKRSAVRLPVRLIENKVFLPAGTRPPALPARPPGPPWRIGWFGAIRCRKSLTILAALAAGGNGAVEVIIRGRPAYDQLPDFDEIVAGTPGLRFEGPYRNPDDLAAIYGEVHFTWAIDMYEQGLNSAWLLPNRLYEGGLYGAVPLALASVATGRFLARRNLGVLLAEPLADDLAAFFAALTPARYADLARVSAVVPRSLWLCGPEECADLVAWLRGQARIPEQRQEKAA